MKGETMAVVITDETPGSAPVATIQDENGNQVSAWVGWNGSFSDLDSWLKACGYVRKSFDPFSEDGWLTTFDLAKF